MVLALCDLQRPSAGLCHYLLDTYLSWWHDCEYKLQQSRCSLMTICSKAVWHNHGTHVPNQCSDTTVDPRTVVQCKCNAIKSMRERLLILNVSTILALYDSQCRQRCRELLHLPTLWTVASPVRGSGKKLDVAFDMLATCTPVHTDQS